MDFQRSKNITIPSSYFLSNNSYMNTTNKKYTQHLYKNF